MTRRRRNRMSDLEVEVPSVLQESRAGSIALATKRYVERLGGFLDSRRNCSLAAPEVTSCDLAVTVWENLQHRPAKNDRNQKDGQEARLPSRTIYAQQMCLL